jgi:hypothetical protein
MPKTLKHDTFETWTIDGDNATWTLAKQAMIDVNDVPGIDVIGSGNRLNIDGRILATDDFGTGIDVDGADTKVVVGKTGNIDATQGISGSTSGMRVVNKGEIEGADYAIMSDEGFTLRNTGDIHGLSAVSTGEGTKIVNGKSGVIEGSTYGLDMTSGVVINHGTITGGTSAIMMGADDINRIVNTGTINGNVVFYGGNIELDTRKGEINGTVFGGDGDDIYKLGKHEVDIVEYEGAGSDLVYSNASYWLADNLDSLRLIGKADISGGGNEDDNYIVGNKGDNDLTGGGGDDYLGSGRGDDLMHGDDGDDIFMFRRGNDKDAITDFTQGEDFIWMRDFNGIDSFADLEDRMSQHGADTWINMGKGDRLIIAGFDKDDLEAGDFSFAEVLV